MQILQQPAYQGLFFLLFSVACTLIARPQTADKVWVAAGTVYVIFLFANTVLSFWSDEVWLYFFISIGISLVYIVCVSITSSLLIKTLKVEGTQESAAMFLVSMMHPVFLLGAMFVKWVWLKIM